MLSLRRLCLLILPVIAIVALLAVAACGGDDDDGGDVDLLPEGDYLGQAAVTLEMEFVGPSASAAPVGGPPSQNVNMSGDITLKMGKDGSFSLEGLGISGTVQVEGDTVVVTATDSPAEGSTGTTDSGGTNADMYMNMQTSNTQVHDGFNEDTIGLTGDPLTNTTDRVILQSGNDLGIEFKDSAGETFARVNRMDLDLNLLPPEETPTPTPTPEPEEEEPTPTPTPSTGGSDVDTARLEQKPGCEHQDVQSDLADLVLAYLVGVAPQSREEGQEAVLVLSIGDEEITLPVAASAVGTETPLSGVTINATATGPGILAGQQSAVTDADGAARLRFPINKFGPYSIVVGSVQAPDGTIYQFAPDSQTSVTFEVGQECQLPEGF